MQKLGTNARFRFTGIMHNWFVAKMYPVCSWEHIIVHTQNLPSSHRLFHFRFHQNTWCHSMSIACRWTSENRTIVHFSESASDRQSEVMRQYRPPTSADEVITQESITVPLNKHNYAHKMHGMLRLEEMTQARIIARYVISITMSGHSNIGCHCI